VSLLSEAERFAVQLMAVPRAAVRLRTYMFKFTIGEKQGEAKKVRGRGVMGAAVAGWLGEGGG
jgi:hypothetical protein